MKILHSHLNFKGLLLRTVSITIVVLILFLLIDAKTDPIVRKYSETAAKNEASIIINDTVTKILNSEKITYNSLVNIEKDKSSNIKAITTDTIKLNLLKSQINSEISYAIEDRGEFNVEIPFGMIFGNSLFSGFGPQIDSSIKMTGNSKCDISNQFLSAGINQTLHRIMLNIEVEILIILPENQTSIIYKTNMCIAETVIVGITPSSFGRIYS